MCLSQASLFLRVRLHQVFSESLAFSGIGSRSIQDRHFDVYVFRNPSNGQDEECYFDVTAFFGRGRILRNSSELDLPAPGTPIDVGSLLGLECLAQAIGVQDDFESLERLLSVNVIFGQWSSDQLSQNIAVLMHDTNAIEATPIRSYDENGVPILHGFAFYQLYVIHQLCHLDSKHDAQRTEVPPRGNHYRPDIGKGCMSFRILPTFHFAGDFINYTFWTHRPEAFLDQNELSAFLSAALYAVRQKWVTKAELLESLTLASVAPEIDKNLRRVVSAI